jgi:predicted translin family RNA/ssDNA-binding protein
VVAQCDSLIEFIEAKKLELINSISKQVDSKLEKVKQEITDYERKLKNATSLLSYSREALNEADPASFLLVTNNIIEMTIY